MKQKFAKRILLIGLAMMYVITIPACENAEKEQEKKESYKEESAENVEKQVMEYTWEEFLALSEEEQEVFFESFETPENFEEWMSRAMSEEQIAEYPWESEGKQPPEYTWEEFLALEDFEQEAFFESFETPENFEEWMNHAMSEEQIAEYPWESEEKQPLEYTWEEFLALEDFEQEAFFESFETQEDFEKWMNSVQ